VIALKPECIVTHSKPEFTLSEERSRVEFKNPQRCEVQEIKVDGCVIADNNEKKCDFLVNVEAVQLSIFLELKGSDVMAAIEQLENTYSHLSGHCYSQVKLLISATRYPRSDTRIQVRKDKISKKSKGKLELIIKNSPHIFPITWK
jgi:signal recognition particle subunit SEC65